MARWLLLTLLALASACGDDPVTRLDAATASDARDGTRDATTTRDADAPKDAETTEDAETGRDVEGEKDAEPAVDVELAPDGGAGEKDAEPPEDDAATAPDAGLSEDAAVGEDATVPADAGADDDATAGDALADDDAASAVDASGGDDAAVASPDAAVASPDAAVASPDAAVASPDAAASDAGSTLPRVVFARNEAGQSRVHTIRFDGSELTRLTNGPGGDYTPSWSPDGTRIAFVSSRGGSFGVYLYDVATRVTSTVATGLFRAGSPSWHPTQDVLAIEGTAMPGGRPDVYTLTIGGALVRRTTDANNDVGPVFAPDGLSLIFASNRSGAYELYRLNLSNNQATRLTTGSMLVGRATLHMNGCELVYARSAGPGASELVSRDLCAAMPTTVALNQAGAEPSFSRVADSLVFSTGRFGGSALMLWQNRAAPPVRLTTGSALASEPAIGPP